MLLSQKARAKIESRYFFYVLKFQEIVKLFTSLYFSHEDLLDIDVGFMKSVYILAYYFLL